MDARRVVWPQEAGRGFRFRPGPGSRFRQTCHVWRLDTVGRGTWPSRPAGWSWRSTSRKLAPLGMPLALLKASSGNALSGKAGGSGGLKVMCEQLVIWIPPENQQDNGERIGLFTLKIGADGHQLSVGFRRHGRRSFGWLPASARAFHDIVANSSSCGSTDPIASRGDGPFCLRRHYSDATSSP